MTKRLNKSVKSETKDRIVSKEEETLWDQVVENVVPLNNSNKQLKAPTNTRRPLKAFNKDGKLQLTSSDRELSHGYAAGLDRATQQKMRRGKIIIEAKIDLHGMTQMKAHQALKSFFYNCQIEGLRSVLVITGKGKDGKGVLRAEVPKWINESNYENMVRAFSFAGPKDGGEGALYVLLKRLK